MAVESAPARGTHFSVQVPIAPALPASAAQPRKRAQPNRLAGLTVLCIDNDPAVLDGMETLLSGWGCHVVKASDVKSAQQAALDKEERPSVLLVDYHLDSGNGIDAVMELRWRLGDLPAILITADRSPHVRNAARAHGMQLLHKPIRPASLRALLAQYQVQIAAE
jgi:CheY-like chemotaxis protein